MQLLEGDPAVAGRWFRHSCWKMEGLEADVSRKGRDGDWKGRRLEETVIGRVERRLEEPVIGKGW